MSQLERQQQILRLLEAHPSLTVREISGTLFRPCGVTCGSWRRAGW